MEVTLNKEAVKAMSKKEFVAMMQHHKNDIDLEAEYDKIVPPVKEVKEKTK